jgi:hypothetical protein
METWMVLLRACGTSIFREITCCKVLSREIVMKTTLSQSKHASESIETTNGVSTHAIG